MSASPFLDAARFPAVLFHATTADGRHAVTVSTDGTRTRAAWTDARRGTGLMVWADSEPARVRASVERLLRAEKRYDRRTYGSVLTPWGKR